MKKWIMRYIKQSLLFKVSLLNLLWIFVSYIEVAFHNPYTRYYVWNYFDLLGRGIEKSDYKNESLYTVLIVVFVMLALLTILHFLSIKIKGLIDVYVVAMAGIMLETCFSLITIHNDICMYCGMFLEIVYMAGLASELSIDR